VDQRTAELMSLQRRNAEHPGGVAGMAGGGATNVADEVFSPPFLDVYLLNLIFSKSLMCCGPKYVQGTERSCNSGRYVFRDYCLLHPPPPALETEVHRMWQQAYTNAMCF